MIADVGIWVEVSTPGWNKQRLAFFLRHDLVVMVAERVIQSTGALPGLRTPHSQRPDPGSSHPGLRVL